MKRYSIIIQKINKSSILVSAKNKNQAIKKVDDFLQNCLKNNIGLDTIFDNKPTFRYKTLKYNNSFTKKNNSKKIKR